MGLWQEMKSAFGEGYDEGRLGAAIGLHLDAMMLAARADGEVTAEELSRIAQLLRRHLRAFSSGSVDDVARSLSASIDRLDKLGDPNAQFTHTVDELVKSGAVACAEAYALAYAVLLADGLNAAERAFAQRLQHGLKLRSDKAQALEHELEAALAC